MPLPRLYRHAWMDDDVVAFREQVRRYVEGEIAPHMEAWRRAGQVSRETWRKFGAMGFLLPELPEEYGGSGVSAAWQLVVQDELTRAEVPPGAGVHSLAAHYILDYGNAEQKRRWLPKMVSRKIGANLLLVVLFLSQLFGAPVNAQSPQNDGGQKIALELQASMDTLAPGEMVTAIVTLADQADLSGVSAESHAGRQGEVVLMLRAKSHASQRAILALLGVRGAQGKVSQVTEFWVFNGLSVTATADVFQAGSPAQGGRDHAGCDRRHPHRPACRPASRDQPVRGQRPSRCGGWATPGKA